MKHQKHKLVFRKSEVENLVKLTRAQKAGRVPYTGGSWGKARYEKGLILVGDNGVYLMSNAPNQQKDNHGEYPVAYAEGCNPNIDPDCYTNKVEKFGGDDGSQFLDIANVELWLVRNKEARNTTGDIVIKISPTSVELFVKTAPQKTYAKK